MKKILQEKKVFQLLQVFDKVLFTKMINADINHGLFSLYKEKIVKHLNSDVWYGVPRLSGLFFQPASKSGLWFLNTKFEKKLIVEESVYFHTVSQGLKNYFNFLCSKNSKVEQYWIDSNFFIEKVEEHFDLEFSGTFAFKGFSKNIVKGFNKSEEEIWQTNISQFGYSEGYNDKDELVKQPNEIVGQIMGDEERVIIPLKGGQLLALNNKSGQKEWFLPINIRENVSYSNLYHRGVIFNNDGKNLWVINSKDGNVDACIHYRDSPIVDSKFLATGRFIVNDEFIVVKNKLTGDIVFIDRESLKVVDFFSANVRFAGAIGSMVWHKDHLYVLDPSYTLHVFKR